MPDTYDIPRHFAHSSPRADRSDWQPLSEHLTAVGALASRLAAEFGAGPLGDVLGRLHDLGKYTDDYQRRIRGENIRVDHSTWGARLACERYGPFGRLLAYCIAGHHAGLANGNGTDGSRTVLSQRLRSELPVLDDRWRAEIELPAGLAPPAGFRPAAEHADRHMFQLSFLARMLFSCLVDADFLDTEAFYDRIEGRTSARPSSPAPLRDLRRELDAHLGRLDRPSEINRIRTGILTHVRAGADRPPGLFSLTVPTGGGKTLTSLAFALDHAIRHGMRRVIFVIPFTSIVEQNAAVFRRALGTLGESAVLEHHSGFVEPPPARDNPEQYQAVAKLRLAMENWDAPIVVTTAVQFFESLFAARPSQCRKLHNIANSVVVIDEAQTMPLNLLRPCVAAIDELARNYRSSVVLCTATQPALEAPAFEGGLDAPHELAPDPPALFRRLARVRVRHVGVWDDATVTRHLREGEQVLCIVNNRRHARALYESIADLAGAFHLTTFMCAAHRSEVLTKVREILEKDLPCRLVSTSLIEAGVDVDFGTVLRAEAGLDSIAQAAGRCNREGLRSLDRSETLVFQVESDEWAPPRELRQYAQKAREVLREHAADPLSPAAIRTYFEGLYWQRGVMALDEHDLMGRLRGSEVENLPLETLAEKFRMIDNPQMPVIIPFDGIAEKAIDSLKFSTGSKGAARVLQRYLVQVPRTVYDILRKSGAVQPVVPEKWAEQFVVLENMDIYDARFGLHWENPSFIRAERLTN